MKYDFDGVIDRTNTNCVKYDLRKMFFESETVLPLWVADMDFETPDFILDALKERLQHPILGYTFRGESFNNSIKEWLLRRHKWPVETDWIEFSPGIVPAINLLVLALTQPDDEIIVQPPVYFPFFTAVTDHNRTLINNPLKLRNGRLHMDFDDLKKKLPTAKMLILCSPHNPGGSVWTNEELTKLAELCVKHDVLVISDEIHCDLLLKGHKHIPLASISKEIADKTITCFAASKTFNLAGVATSAVIISNDDIRKKYKDMLQKLHVGMGNIFGAIATETALTKGDDWLDQMLDYVNSNIDFFGKYLTREIPQIKMIRPEATYMVWLDCRKLGLNDKELKKFIIEKAGLGLNDGPMFGQGGSGFQRINLACPRILVVEALDKLKNAVSSLANN